MADIELEREHQMSLAQAKAVAQQVAEEMASEYGLQSNWQDNTLHFSRPGVNGTLTVDAKTMVVAVTLGFLFKAFAGKFREHMAANMDQLLAQQAAKSLGKTTTTAPAKAPPKTRSPK